MTETLVKDLIEGTGNHSKRKSYEDRILKARRIPRWVSRQPGDFSHLFKDKSDMDKYFINWKPELLDKLAVAHSRGMAHRGKKANRPDGNLDQEDLWF